MSRPPISIWQQHKELFRWLYLEKGFPLEKVKKVAESDYGFPVTPQSTYETKFRDELKLRKNLKPEEWAVIGRHLESRGSQSNVYLCGVRICPTKVKRYARRYKRQGIQDNSRLPPDVTVGNYSDIGNTSSLVLRENALPARRRLQYATPNTQSPDGTQITTARPLLSGQECTPPGNTDLFVEILSSGSNAVPFVRFSAAILDRRVAEQMNPLLNNLPIIQFQALIQTYLAAANRSSSYFSVSPLLSQSLSWDSSSLRPREEIEFTDAACLTLIRNDWAIPFNKGIEPPSTVTHHFDFRLSTFRNPLHALTMTLHALSNNCPTKFYVNKHNFFYWRSLAAEEAKLFDLMDDFAQQVPESLLTILIGLDCESIGAAWPELLNWTLRVDNAKVFRSLAAIVLKSLQWIDYCPNHAKLRIMASWFGFGEICNSLLVNYKCCLNKRPLLAFPLVGHDNRDPVRRYRRRYTALAAAAIRGNVEIVGSLLRNNAEVDRRCEGFTPAGHVLMALKKDNQYRDRRLQVLSLLLAANTDIYGDFVLSRGNATNVRHRNRLLVTRRPSTSTLLDEAFLSPDTEVAGLFRRYIRNGHDSQISRSGIILAAEDGAQAFSDYLRNTCSSEQGQERRTIELASLYWCLDKQRIDAISSMLQSGFDITELAVTTPRKDLSRGTDVTRRIYKPFLDVIFHQESPVISASMDIVSFIFSNYQGCHIVQELIHSCLESTSDEFWRLLFNNVLNSAKSHSGVVIMSLAARLNNFGAVSMLNQAPFNINSNEDESYWNARYSVLFLSSATIIEPSCLNTPFSLLRNSRPANTKMLEFLVQRGADIATCHPSAWTRQLWVAGEQLKWLLRSGLSTENASIYSFMAPQMRQPSNSCISRDSQGCCAVHNVQRGIIQWLLERRVPVFSPKEAASLLYQNSETPLHPLSFFISLQPGQGILDRILEFGINVNGRGGDPRHDTPLMAAARAGDANMVERLVSLGARVKVSGFDCELSALQLACGGFGDLEGSEWDEYELTPDENADSIPRGRFRRVVELLLKAGGNSNDRGTLCCVSPLLLATDAKIVQLLLAHGADPNEYYARECFHGCEESGFLKRHPFNQFFSRFKRITVLRHVVTQLQPGLSGKSWKTHYEVVEALLDGGARVVDEKADQGCDVIGDAMQRSLPHGHQVELVTLLLRYAAIQDPQKNPINRMHLLLACANDNLDLVNLLLKRNASPNPINPKELPPLSVAAKRGDLALALLLVTAGAIVDPVTEELDMCPLVCAAEDGRTDMASFLLKNGDPRQEVVEKAISSAISRGHIQLALFIQRNSKRWTQDSSSRSCNSCKHRDMIGIRTFERMDTFGDWLLGKQWLSEESQKRKRLKLNLDGDSSGDDV